eukprot:TRINITY_DN20489_c1_g3_i1.p1 TRINITY_DN20489_c1_g3~~TRINITY_DN20489_c1_g3_i1.p1  ORF type:complete len:659 (-),score=175.71 TRINITY_DN20489_c1_g3_i1:113-2038(-)
MAALDGRAIWTPAEVSWCRQHAERAEAEYAAMVDGLLAENEQLEKLARVLAKQGADALGGDSSVGSSAASKKLLQQVDEVLLLVAESRRQRDQELASLQQELRAEQQESQLLRRRVEEALRELAAAKAESLVDGIAGAGRLTVGEVSAGAASAAAGRDALKRLSQVEKALEAETRQRELAEARCLLVESRCQQLIARLEGEVALGPAARTGDNGSAYAGDRRGTLGRTIFDGTSSYGGSGHSSTGAQTPDVGGGSESPLLSDSGDRLSAPPGTFNDKFVTLKAQLTREREAHRQRVDLYNRYVVELAAACGRPVPAGLVDGVGTASSSASLPPPNGVNGAQASSSSRRSSRGGSGPFFDTATASDEEDYTWTSYVEREVGRGTGVFEKVYLELRLTQLAVYKDRASIGSPIAAWPVSSLVRQVQVVDGEPDAKRCFEVAFRGADAPEVIISTFRCVSARRAEQWAQAINRAWQHGQQQATAAGGGQSRPAAAAPAGGQPQQQTSTSSLLGRSATAAVSGVGSSAAPAAADSASQVRSSVAIQPSLSSSVHYPSAAGLVPMQSARLANPQQHVSSTVVQSARLHGQSPQQQQVPQRQPQGVQLQQRPQQPMQPQQLAQPATLQQHAASLQRGKPQVLQATPQ